MNWQKVRFVHLLTAFVSMAMLSMLVLQWFVSYCEAKQSLYTTTFQLNADSAKKMGITMNTVFRSMQNTMKGNAKHLTEQLEIGDELQPHVDHFMESNDFFNGMIVVDRTGNVVATSEKNTSSQERLQLSQLYNEARDVRTPTISKPYRTETGDFIVLMTYPIVDARGDFFGYLGGTIHLHENNVLNDIFGVQTNSESGTYTYVVDPSGHLLYHPDSNRIGENVAANPVVQKVMQGQHGSEEVTNTKGDVFAAGYAPVTENGWGIVVQTPVEEIRKQAIQIIVKEMLYTLPIFLLLLITTIMLARKLAAPFSLLAKTAEQFMAGHPVDDVPRHALFSYEANQLYKTVLLAMNKLHKRAEQLMNEAQTDPLTGLPNRRTMNALMETWIEENRPFSVVAIDIDFFKQVNDTYGHQVGDEVLQFLANILRAHSRKGDCSCRYGGEEFVILLPNTPYDEAYQMSERIRTLLEQKNSPTGRPITISCGVAAYPDHAQTAHELLNCADEALYTAKRQGRNRTIIYASKRAFPGPDELLWPTDMETNRK